METKLIIRKKILKFSFLAIISIVVILNVLTAWALPYEPVTCMRDSIINYIIENNLNLKLDSMTISTINIISDIIFLISIYIYILKNGRRKFTYNTIILIIFKILMDYIFYQRNIYKIEKIVYSKSLITDSLKIDSSLFNLQLSLLLNCYLEVINDPNINYLIKLFNSIHLITIAVYLVFSELVMSFQILFSVLIVDYIRKIDYFDNN